MVNSGPPWDLCRGLWRRVKGDFVSPPATLRSVTAHFRGEGGGSGKGSRGYFVPPATLIAKQRKLIVSEVKSDHSGEVPSKARATLMNTKTFADLVFNILGIQDSEIWEYIPLVALPNVEGRDKLDRKYCSHLEYIITQTELNSDISSKVWCNYTLEFGRKFLLISTTSIEFIEIFTY